LNVPCRIIVARAGRDAHSDAGHRGEQRVREAGEQDTHDEDQEEVLQAGGRAVLGGAAGVAVLAQVEDVLHHGEAERGQAAVDDAVGDAGPLAAPPPEQQDRAERLHRLLDERRDQHGDQRVGEAPALEELGRLGVDHQGRGGGDRGAPGEAEGQIADRLGLVAVEPEERGDQQRNRQHRGDQAHRQAGQADVHTEEEQHADRAGQQERDDPDHRAPAPPAGLADHRLERLGVERGGRLGGNDVGGRWDGRPARRNVGHVSQRSHPDG
jgi:hypothetical protein